MFHSRLRRAVLLVVVSCLAISVAHAEAPNVAAKRLYQSASHHYELQQYDEALADFKAAYDLKDDPVFLFNIAQCQRLLSQREPAVRSYKMYLARSPNARNRADVESRITTLQAEIDAEHDRVEKERAAREKDEADARAARIVATPVGVVGQTAEPARRTPVYKKWWLWTTVGVVVVGVGLGVGLGLGLSRSHTDAVGSQVTF